MTIRLRWRDCTTRLLSYKVGPPLRILSPVCYDPDDEVDRLRDQTAGMKFDANQVRVDFVRNEETDIDRIFLL